MPSAQHHAGDLIAGAFCIGPWLVEPSLQRISSGDVVHHVEPRNMRVLTCLAERPGMVVRREHLYDAVWGEVVVNEEALTRAVSELRKMLDDDPTRPRFIQTLRGRGYRLIAPVERPVVVDGPVAVSFGGDGQSGELLLASPSRPRRLWWMGAALLMATAGLTAWLTLGRTATPPDTRPLAISPLTTFQGFEVDPAVSPGGTEVAYAWGRDYWSEEFDLYVKQPGVEKALRLTTMPGAERDPAWSPDGTTVAFAHTGQAGTALFTVPALGGSPRKLAEARSWIHGLDWSPDGRFLVFAAREEHGGGFRLILLNLQTRRQRRITLPGAPAVQDHSPAFSPDGRRVAFVRDALSGAGDVYVTPVDDGETPRRITRLHTRIRGVDWTADGRQLVFSTLSAGVASLWRVDARGGVATPIPSTGGNVGNLSIARGAGLMAAEEPSFQSDIRELALGAGAEDGPGVAFNSTRWDGEATYAPRGQRMAFVSSRSGHPEIWVAHREDESPLRLTSLQGPPVGPPHWSPDGTHIAFSTVDRGERVIYTVDADGGKPVQRGRGSGAAVVSGWSRDGRWIYFASDRTGTWQVWKLAVDHEETIQVTTDGGLAAHESPDGHDLFFTRPDADGIWVRSVDGGPARLLVSDLRGFDWNNWTVAAGAFYYVQREDTGPFLARYDLSTGQTTALRPLPDVEDYGFAVSPDAASILLTEERLLGSDLLIGEDL